VLVAEASQERRLADARLSAGEHDLPPRTALHALQAFTEHRELAGALE